MNTKSWTILFAGLCLSACKIAAPVEQAAQDVSITGSKPELSQAELSLEPDRIGPPIIISDNVVLEDVQPVPVTIPVSQPVGPQMKALTDCRGYFPYDGKLLADGTVQLAYSSITSGMSYPVSVSGWTFDTKRIWLLDLGNGRLDYFEESCLAING